MVTYTPAMVSFDDGDTVYPALVLDGQLWNGFVLPFFTLDTIALMGAEMAEIHRDSAPRFYLENPSLRVEQDGEDAYRIQPTVMAYGDVRYGVGAGSWTWSIVDSTPTRVGKHAA